MLLNIGIPLIGLVGLFLLFRPPKKANLRLVRSAFKLEKENSEGADSRSVRKRITGVR